MTIILEPAWVRVGPPPPPTREQLVTIRASAFTRALKLGAGDVADDVAQEVVRRVIKNWNSLGHLYTSGSEESEAHLSGYTRSVTSNTMRSEKRRRRREQRALAAPGTKPDRPGLRRPLPFWSSSPSAERQALGRAEGQRIVKMIDDLPAQQRLAARLVLVDERSYQEVAAMLSTTEGTVRKQVLRARAKLRQRIEGERGDWTEGHERGTSWVAGHRHVTC